MTTPKRLSPEELDRIQEWAGNRTVPKGANVHALLDHIVALEAERSREMEARGALIARANALEQHASDLETSLENARKERDGAVADMAAMVETWRTGDGGVAVVLERILGHDQPHPGAALLEEHRKTREALDACRQHVRETGEQHRKALVLARNEGLRKAADAFASTPMIASRIRAMTEPE